MAHGEEHHAEMVAGLAKELKPVLENSKQGVYIYLDDNHWTCNKKFATLLGYKSPGELISKVRKESFLDVVVDVKDQRKVQNHYFGSMKNLTGTSFSVNCVKKSGGKAKFNVILVPITYKDHLFSLHFVWK